MSASGEKMEDVPLDPPSTNPEEPTENKNNNNNNNNNDKSNTATNNTNNPNNTNPNTNTNSNNDSLHAGGNARAEEAQSGGETDTLPPGLALSALDPSELPPHSTEATFLARRFPELRRCFAHLRRAIRDGTLLHTNGAPVIPPTRDGNSPFGNEGPVINDRREGGAGSGPGEAVADAWLVLSVNHFNLEQERVLVLTDRSLLRVKYDFLNGRVLSVARLPLSSVLRIQLGRLKFPESSLTAKLYTSDISRRVGFRVFTGLSQPSFADRWNPWSKTMPFTTYRAHTSMSEDQEMTNRAMDAAARKIFEACKIFNEDVDLKTEDVEISSYAGIFSQVHNEGYLGAQKIRGPVSF